MKNYHPILFIFIILFFQKIEIQANNTFVPASGVTPIIVATGELTCYASSVLLDGSSSIGTGTLTFEWFNSSNELISTNQLITVTDSSTYTLVVTDIDNNCSDQASIIVEPKPEAPLADAGMNVTLPCGQAFVVLDGSNSESSFFIFYEWKFNSNTVGNAVTLNASQTGVYTLRAYDVITGCESIDTVEVLQDPNSPTAAILPFDDLTCIQDSVILSASVPTGMNTLTYEWKNSIGQTLGFDPTLKVFSAGTYILEVTDSDSGCSTSTFASVENNMIPPNANAGLDGTITCDQGSYELNAINSTLGNNIIFTWHDSNGVVLATGVTYMASDSGEYTLVVRDSDNGCSATDKVTVIINNTSPTPSIVAITDLNISCSQNSLVVDGSASSPIGEVTYEWELNGTTISTQPNPEISEGGELVLTVTDMLNGCTAELSTTITENAELPNIEIAEPEILTCTVSEIQLDGTASASGMNITYLWTGPGTIINETTSMPTVSEEGTYIFSVSNTENGCVATMEVEVIENIEPPTAIAIASNQLDCIHSEVSLDATASSTGNMSYEWTTTNGVILSGANTMNPIVSQQGTYMLTIVDLDNDCEASTTVNVIENNDAVNGVNYVTTAPVCEGDLGSISIESTVGGVPPFLYSLDFQPFTTASTFSFLPSGNYTIVVEDANGCQYSEVASIAPLEEIQLFLPSETRITLGDTYTFDPQINVPLSSLESIEWTSSDSLSCTDCLNPSISISDSKHFTLTVTTTSGCKASASMWVQVEKPRNVFIPNIFTPNGDGQNDVFQIFADETMVKQINMFRVFTRWGDLVFEAKEFLPNIADHGWDGYLDGQKMNPAVFIYFTEIEFIDGRTEVYRGDVVLK